MNYMCAGVYTVNSQMTNALFLAAAADLYQSRFVACSNNKLQRPDSEEWPAKLFMAALWNRAGHYIFALVNFRPLAAEMGPVLWGTPANFNGFRVLAALLHGTPVLSVSQTLRR